MSHMHGPRNIGVIKALTFVMFMMFAMTTDSVGVVIPEVIRQFHLSLTAASAFQYATMTGIALAGFFLGYLADRYGRKSTIVVGLCLFSLNSYLFVAGDSFLFFLGLLAVSGVAIGVFKTGALALIGDISKSTAEHTSTMNLVEGFFGVGAIIGPAILARLLAAGVSWKWLYVIAGTMCVVLIITALAVKYPETRKPSEEEMDLRRTFKTMKNPFVLLFSLGAFLYVAAECAVYVWMPTLLAGDPESSGGFLAVYSISIFFILRAGGRFLGAWMLTRVRWTVALSLFSGAILACFAASVAGGPKAALYLLPLSGLFMSVVYPTINSKGISCFPKSEHGGVAGVILFFTCAAAALGPLAMGAVSDVFGGPRYGFVLATGFAAALFAFALYNWIYDPTHSLLSRLDRSEYQLES
jgi:FHS family L-fucose permease-like MFS transporter